MLRFFKYVFITFTSGIAAFVLFTLDSRVSNEAERAKWQQGSLQNFPAKEPHFEQAPRPNLLIIMADDLGFTDIGAFGSEIPTPNIDKLAKGGVRLTNFYTESTCAPTRAMLMTGNIAHAVGIGAVLPSLRLPWQQPNPSYSGTLSQNTVTLAEALKSAGYATSMAGKWHLGDSPEADPSVRGFDQSYALIDGAASHFDDAHGVVTFKKKATYRENGSEMTLPEGFYSTDAYTSKIIDYIDGRPDKNQPFFAYLSYTAPHWPVQAPDNWIDRFKGVYDQGFAPILESRIERAANLGLTPTKTSKSENIAELDKYWKTLGPNDRASSARRMEVFAAMVSKMDEQIGRVVNHLRQEDQLDNTLILFLSDNGADFSYTEALLPNRRWVSKTFNNSLDNIGRKGSNTSYGPEWASVGSGPLKYFKGLSSEGGIKSPAILHWPQRIKPRVQENRFATVMDILPTFVELAGATIPRERNGVPILQPYGRSFAKISSDNETSEFHHADYPVVWESTASRAVRKGGWKLVYLPEPVGENKWRLYNLKNDPNESRDVSAQNPQKLSELITIWESFDAAYVVESPPKFMRKLLFKTRPKSLD